MKREPFAATLLDDELQYESPAGSDEQDELVIVDDLDGEPAPPPPDQPTLPFEADEADALDQRRDA